MVEVNKFNWSFQDAGGEGGVHVDGGDEHL